MKPWINEDIFKSWTEAQKRLWESLCSAVPFQPPAGVEAWRETYLKNLNTWESAVKQTLEQEVAWVEQWVHQVAQERGKPEMMTAWVRQMEEVLQRWIQTQNQWWDEYFMVLRRGGFAYPDWVHPPASSSAVEPVVVAESAVTKPAPPATPAPETIAEPSIAEPVAAASDPLMAKSTTAIPEAAPPVEPILSIPPVAESPDDLKLISGIGPALEKKLRTCGITTYQQLATLSEADIERIEAIIKSFGRIRRDDWIGQAKVRYFEKYQETP
jgi:predicted flap endonuclease-1-like 5' DNA nuclease